MALPGVTIYHFDGNFEPGVMGYATFLSRTQERRERELLHIGNKGNLTLNLEALNNGLIQSKCIS